MNRDGASPESAGTDEQRSFNKLWARIEASESASTGQRRHGRRAAPRRVLRAPCAGWRRP